MISPKTLFLQQEELAKWHLSLVKSDNFEKSVVIAMAQMMTEHPSSDQIRGANRFLDLFIGLSHKEEPEKKSSLVSPQLVPWEKLTEKEKK